MLSARGTGLLLGAAADVLLGDPARFHPVAGFGSVAARLESRLWVDSRAAGASYVAACLLGPAVAAVAVERAARGRPVRTALATGMVTWAVLGGRSLQREASRLGESLADGDVATARSRLPALCGRDPRGLDVTQLSRATVESVAENTADAVVAPLCWGAVAGVPGLVIYRAVNTLDAMVGHRNARYARFGWAAARLDDLANLVPARATAALAVACAALVGADSRGAWRAWRRDGAKHPSPNAGRCEASFAGALGVRLGGRNVYGGRVDDRPVLGAGRPAGPPDIARAVRLSAAVGAVAAVLAALGSRR